MMLRSCAAILVLLLPPACVFAGSTELKVAADGSAQYKTIQSAIDAAPANSKDRVTITIQPGTYKERLEVPKDKTMLTFKGAGDDPSRTILTHDWSARTKNPEGKEVGTSGSRSTLISATDFTAENVTFENSAGDVGQAVAVKFNSDRGIFRNCRFLGWQDTLYVHDRRVYFKDCYIEGRVDFIFGKSTAVFDHCTIHSKNGGCVTAAATPQEVPFGFVFLNCRLTGDGNKALLGRPWRAFAAVALLNCEMGDHIKPEGWQHWNDMTEGHDGKTSRYSEYKSTGPGANPEKRVDWSHQLTDDEAKKYTIDAILGGDDHWDPTATSH